ncbi:MAG: hypothetical protein O2793_14335 [Proteobacteria bacterium]|nr:hypothetical protein [Pseudomonadota bacterium]MDA1254972.1 hypothetical protein [Pseudomonadota bacterium]
MDKKEEALRIVEEGLKELESQKGSITVAVQKLSRASDLLEEKDDPRQNNGHIVPLKIT